MATFGSIPADLNPPASFSIRVNAADNGWEIFKPGASSSPITSDASYGISEPWLDTNIGFDGALIPAIAERTTSFIYPRGGSFASIGIETATHGTPSFSNTNLETEGVSTSFSQAGAGASGGISCNFAPYVRGSLNRPFTGFRHQSAALFPDASYNETGASTGSRIFYGITSNTGPGTQLNSDAPTGHFAGFSRRHVNAGDQDTNWRFLTRDGTTTNNIDTGMAFAVSKLYRFFVYVAPAGTTVYWRIDNITDSTSFTGDTTTNIPGATTALTPLHALFTVNATARIHRFKYSHTVSGV